ncbi:MAG: YciI family protein [Lawsonella sp.]
MAVFAYQYTYDSTKTEEMDAIRPLHRGYLGEGAKAGKVLASGPFAGGKSALIIVRFDTADDAAEFMDQDPFYKHGLVAERVINEWTDVLGAFKGF